MRIIGTVILIFILFSCNKERTLHISAINTVTNLPYSGLTYYVVEEKTGLNGEKSTTVATGQLNENGEVFANVKIKKNRSYVIRVEMPPNNCYFNKISYAYSIHQDENPHFKFEFAECSYLKMNIKNINCTGQSDLMRFRFKQNYFPDWEGWSSDRFGCYDFSSPGYYSIPAGMRIYEWEVTRNGVLTIHKDSLFLSAGEEGTFDLFY